MAAIQSTLTKYSTPYLPSPGLYFGAPIHQHTGSGSGVGSASTLNKVTKAKSGTGSGVGSSSSNKLRIVPRGATGFAIGGDTAVTSGPTQFRLGGLSDYSFPYLNGGRFYVGAPLKQRAATGSGVGASSSASFPTRARMGTGSGVGTQSATGVRIAFRTASGSAIGGDTAIASGPIQLRLGGLTDYSFPYLTGGRYYLGPARYQRTASASGSGNGSATFRREFFRSATGSGAAGESATTDLEILFRSATGSGVSSDYAFVLTVWHRTATGSGSGESSAAFRREHLRTSTSSTGTGSSASIRVIARFRSGTGSGIGTSTAVRVLVGIRTATGSGVGVSTSNGLHIAPRPATGSGTGSNGSVIWTKSRIFRVPQTTTYSLATMYDSYTPKERLMAHITPRIRAENLYRLSDGTYTINDPRGGAAVRTYLGAHNIFLDDTEVAELTAAGYGEYIT